MPSLITNADAESSLRRTLSTQGFSLSSERSHGETGVDIVATRGKECFHIEVIGHKASGPARAKDFYEAFFRAISRVKDGASRCVIALPKRAQRGLPARARQYGVAWARIGDAFPELKIWLIDTENDSYQSTSWNDWSSAALP